MTHASCRADDQDVLPRLHVPRLTKRMERRAAGGGDGRGLLDGEVRGLRRNLVDPSGRILGESAVAGAEHLIAPLEVLDVLPDSLDAACEVGAADAGLGRAEPGAGDPEQVRETGHEVPVTDVCARGEYAYEHVVVSDPGLLDVLELQDVGRAVAVLHDRLHRILRGCGAAARQRTLRVFHV
jgi:hypothetical protein